MDAMQFFNFEAVGSVTESRKLEGSKGQFAHVLKLAVGTFTAAVDTAEPLWRKAGELKKGDMVKVKGHRELNYKNEPRDVVTSLEVVDELALLNARMAALKGSGNVEVPAKRN